VLRFAGKVALLCCDHHAPRSAVHTPRRALVHHNRARMGSPTRSRDSDGLGTNRKVCYAWSEFVRRGWWLSTLCIRAGANIWCIPRREQAGAGRQSEEQGEQVIDTEQKYK